MIHIELHVIINVVELDCVFFLVVRELNLLEFGIMCVFALTYASRFEILINYKIKVRRLIVQEFPSCIRLSVYVFFVFFFLELQAN